MQQNGFHKGEGSLRLGDFFLRTVRGSRRYIHRFVAIPRHHRSITVSYRVDPRQVQRLALFSKNTEDAPREKKSVYNNNIIHRLDGCFQSGSAPSFSGIHSGPGQYPSEKYLSFPVGPFWRASDSGPQTGGTRIIRSECELCCCCCC